MTHEQKPESAEFRTREAHRQHIAQAWQDEGMRQPLAEVWADRELSEAEARGAAEQRRKDAEGAEASFAWLVEDMRKTDKSAPPSARFDMLFGDDEVSISEARERLEAMGVESLYITDDWEDATEGNELSRADVEALPPLHEDEQKAGWKLASAWDTEGGTVIRHYVRPLRTAGQDTANVAALEARVKVLEGENKAWSDAAANALTWLKNGRQANARDELKAVQRRAAAPSAREASDEDHQNRCCD